MEDASIATDSDALMSVQDFLGGSPPQVLFSELADEPVIDYTYQMDCIMSVSVFAILAMGVICGLMLSYILLWRIRL